MMCMVAVCSGVRRQGRRRKRLGGGIPRTRASQLRRSRAAPERRCGAEVDGSMQTESRAAGHRHAARTSFRCLDAHRLHLGRGSDRDRGGARSHGGGRSQEAIRRRPLSCDRVRRDGVRDRARAATDHRGADAFLDHERNARRSADVDGLWFEVRRIHVLTGTGGRCPPGPRPPLHLRDRCMSCPPVDSPPSALADLIRGTAAARIRVKNIAPGARAATLRELNATKCHECDRRLE